MILKVRLRRLINAALFFGKEIGFLISLTMKFELPPDLNRNQGFFTFSVPNSLIYEYLGNIGLLKSLSGLRRIESTC